MRMPPYMRERVVLEARSGAVSGPVTVSYFDPRTGEPTDARCEPLHAPAKAPDAQAGYLAALERGRRKRPVSVDGTVYESIAAASRAAGCSRGRLGNALRSGATEYGGHAIGFA